MSEETSRGLSDPNAMTTSPATMASGPSASHTRSSSLPASPLFGHQRHRPTQSLTMALEQARQSQAPRRPLNPLAPAYVPLSHIQPETQHSSQRRRQQATGGESQQNIVAQVSENSTPTVTGLLDFNVSRDNQTGNLQIHLGTRTHEVTSDEVDSWWADWYTNQGVGSGPLSRMRLYDFLAAEERSVTDALTSTPSIPNMADAATLGQASGVRKRRRTSLAGSQRYEEAPNNGLRQSRSSGSLLPAIREPMDDTALTQAYQAVYGIPSSSGFLSPPLYQRVTDPARRTQELSIGVSEPRKPLLTLHVFDIIPQSFEAGKRAMLCSILRSYAHYFPKFVNFGVNHSDVTRPKRKPRISKPKACRLGPNGRGWPQDEIPVEIFQNIAHYLPRESLKQMRLVNHDFERKISNALFHTVVVPFREEIYGMILRKASAKPSKCPDFADQEKLREAEKNVDDGMRVFEAWGHHIRKFAMAFEVDEATLEKPPEKGKFESHPTFWGSYDWPHPYYHRFEACEGLEKKADEFRCMSDALSNLNKATELGLSIDSGLGWLNGPDISDRARLFRTKPEIFGNNLNTLDDINGKREQLWQVLQKRAKPPLHPKLISNPDLHTRVMMNAGALPNQLTGPGGNMANAAQLAIQEAFRAAQTVNSYRRLLIFNGINLESGANVSSGKPSEDAAFGPFTKLPLIPNNLTTAQQEWLLETEWAQRAFLSSFCMALCDNSKTFQNVRTLTISRLSNKYLTALDRDDVWISLASLENLVIFVSPEWRSVSKSASGLVQSASIKPSSAAADLYALLKNQISHRQNIKSLALGYVGGGEHQSGIFGRNRSVLPAPVSNFADICTSLTPESFADPDLVMESMIFLPHLELLTFKNCWFAPRVLKQFVLGMRAEGLKSLVLDSVSLTTASFGISPGNELLYEAFNTTELGRSTLPQGYPRLDDPLVGDLFDGHRISMEKPASNGWPTRGVRVGSWSEVINAITPGANMELLRYAYQYSDKDFYKTKMSDNPDNHRLKKISLESCGYVLLTHIVDSNQPLIGNVESRAIGHLGHRAHELAQVVMLAPEDKMLGQIVPSFPEDEEQDLTSAFLMEFGWKDDVKAAENREDGQPAGGSGRFSGSLRRLKFPEQSWDDV